METSPGLFSRLGEKVLGWIALALLIALGVAVWQTPAATKAAIWSTAWRTAAWLALAALAPWATRPFMRRLVDAGTNWAGIAVLATLTAFDLVAAFALMSSWPGGGWSWFLCLGLLALAGVYNYLVAEYLAEQAGG